ncbi:MAG: efflux RND transporter periplasmic adaptor subunit [Acidobacteria bacterium]|nr:efflux RND transporter periplasmic adaptor subunit [Acidobacteriota bacterium]
MLLASLFILCLIGGVWSVTSRRLPKLSALFAQSAAEPVSYTVKKTPFTVTVPANGELETATATQVSVPNVRTGGLKVFWIIKDGSPVKKGDTLVEFDASELLQQMEETENNLAAALRQLEATVLRGNSETEHTVVDHQIASMELDKAQTQMPRDTEIFTRNQIIEGELNIGLSTTKVGEWTGKADTKRQIGATSQRILVIERKQHETKQGMIKQSLGSLKILAPHDGLALLTKDDAGNTTAIGEARWPGYALMALPDTAAMKARVQVLEADAGNLKVGQAARVTVDSHPGTKFDATIERIDTLARQPDKDSPVKYFEVVMKVEGRGGEILKPGKLVRAEITTASYDQALIVPRVAVVEEELKHYVWVQGNGTPEKRAIEIGSGDTARVVIKSGVNEGEAVLLNPRSSALTGKEQTKKSAEVLP